MLIVCPSCSSRYELDAAKLGPAGRKVRCASCKTLWHVDPAQDFPAAPDEDETRALLEQEMANAAALDEQITAVAAEAVPVPTEDPPAPPPRPRRRNAGKKTGRSDGKGARRALALPMAAAFAGLAVMGVLLWQREAAVRAAPQLASLFAGLGMPVNIRGLTLGAIESGLSDDGLGRFLVVEGDITNVTRHGAPVPPIEVSVRDGAGQTLYTWTTTAPKPELEPAELVRFRARLASPPDEGRSVQVRFAPVKPTGLASAH